MRIKTVASMLVLAAFAVAQGCSSSESTEKAGDAKSKAAKAKSSSGVSVSAMADAKSIFSTRCATCHGATGRGDGPGSTNLDPKPRDYSDAEWQKTVTDDEIEKVIVYGGAAVGKSPIMVANPDLSSKPDVVKGLREMVRGFAK